MDTASTSAVDSGSESEEDYMSEAFIAKMSNIRPGLAKTVSEQRVLKIEATKCENIERLRNVPRRADIEKQMRDAGLAKPLGEESKGFALLQKMGYKPGMSLGVKREGTNEGIKQPIVVDIKTSRTGLGHEKEQEAKQKRNAELHLQAALAKSKANLFLLGDFRKRKRAATLQKQIYADLKKSRKACEDLDLRKGLTSPCVPEFWPIYEIKNEVKLPLPIERTSVNYIKDEGVFKYSNGKLAPPESGFDELREDELIDRLEDITLYLRSEHLYCIWCGCQYQSLDELQSHCPGSTRNAHEGSDGE